MPRTLVARTVRFALLYTAFIAVIAPAPLAAQTAAMAASPPSIGTDGLFPGPVRTQELRRTLHAAGASPVQFLAAADALEAHHQAYHDLRDQILLPCLLEHASMTRAFNLRTLPARHA